MADGDYVRLRAACFCGEPAKLKAPGPGRPPTKCERHSSKPSLAKNLPEVPCPECGTPFLKDHWRRAFCSARCSGRVKKRRLKGHVPLGTKRPAVCKHCAARFQAGTQTKQIFCSKTCKIDAHSGRPVGPTFRPAAKTPCEPPKTVCQYRAGYCEGCGKVYGHRGTRPACSEKCAALAQGMSQHRAAGRVTTCAGCSTQFCPMYGSSLAQLCAPCADLRVRAARSAAKALRRAMHRGANGGERFDPLEVLRRDRWRCKLCGRKTPERKRGSYDDDAPELDHIVPVALGGKHTRANTQCACRACNSAKGATPLGQLNLALA